MVRRYPREATSLGAAIAAGIGVGTFPDFHSVLENIGYERIYEPDKDKVEEYRRFYNVYKMMYPCLKPIFGEISRL